MIDVDKAKWKIHEKYPSKTIREGFDYDKDWYIFTVTDTPNAVDFNAPYYAVNKESGDVRCFTPGEDLDKFFDVIENKKIFG